MPAFLFSLSNKSSVFDIRLGRGDDEVIYEATGDFNAASRNLRISLGKGGDRFLFDADGNDVTNLSDLRFDITGGRGNDLVAFNCSGVSNSDLSVQVALGKGNDAGGIGFSDRIDFGDCADRLRPGEGDNELGMAFEGVGSSNIAQVNVDILGSDHATGHER